MIVLDTHAWLWWMSAPDRLSPTAQATIAAERAVGVSTMSAYEVAMLVSRGRIGLDRDVRTWVRRALTTDRVEALAPGLDVALGAALLDRQGFPGDPADRIIYFTARSLDAKLVTRDAQIRTFDPAGTVW